MTCGLSNPASGHLSGFIAYYSSVAHFILALTFEKIYILSVEKFHQLSLIYCLTLERGRENGMLKWTKFQITD